MRGDAEERMTLADVMVLLTRASAYDGREPDPTEAQVWHRHLRWIRPADAMAALEEHFDQESRRLMVADVVNRVGEWREQWQQRGPAGARYEDMPVGGQPPAAALVSGAELGRALMASGALPALEAADVVEAEIVDDDAGAPGLPGGEGW